MAAVPSVGRASLVERPAAREAAATHALYESHSRRIYSYCQHQLGSREEAEDAMQIVFMNAFRALSKGVVPQTETAWLFKIAENVCLSRRRSSWRRERIESPGDFAVIEEIVPGPSHQRDELIGIEDALVAMPEQQRRAILLREWQGLSYREIAEEMELSQAAVETLIFRARRTLAAGLTEPDAAGKKKGHVRRAMHAFDLSSLVGAAKALLSSGAAVKATVAAVAVTAAATGTAVTVSPAVRHAIEGTKPATVHWAPASEPAPAATPGRVAAIVAAAAGAVAAVERSSSSGGVAPVFGPVFHPDAGGRIAPIEGGEPSQPAGGAADPASSLPLPSFAPSAPSTPTAAPPAAKPEAARPAAAPPAPAVPPKDGGTGRKGETPSVAPPVAPRGADNDGKGKENEGGRTADTPAAAPTPSLPVTSSAKDAGAGDQKGKGAGKDDPQAASPVVPTAAAAQSGDEGKGNRGDRSRAADASSRATQSVEEPRANDSSAFVPLVASEAAPAAFAVEQRSSNETSSPRREAPFSMVSPMPPPATLLFVPQFQPAAAEQPDGRRDSGGGNDMRGDSGDRGQGQDQRGKGKGR